MNHPAAAEAAIREKLATYTDPYLGQSLGGAKAVSSVTLRQDALEVELALGFPCADYAAELGAALTEYLGGLLGSARLDLKLTAQITVVSRPRETSPQS